MTHRIAMWSGPRNISTAMMRSWENRPDCCVIDEPFYACYLKHSNVTHPGQEDILKSQPTDWKAVIDQLTQSTVEADIFYQKQMTHHIPKSMELKWTQDLTHVFLIRDPYQVINSYIQKRPDVTQEDIGIIRQYELYQQLSEITGQSIPIIDANDVLADPGQLLTMLCQKLNISFYPQMLNWPTGPRETDGVWAPYWYQNVEQSSGFKPLEKRQLHLPKALEAMAQEAMPYYLKLYKLRLELPQATEPEATRS